MWKALHGVSAGERLDISLARGQYTYSGPVFATGIEMTKFSHPVWTAKSTLNPSAHPLRWIGGCGWITVRAQFGGLADGYSMDSIDQINFVDTWWIRGGLVDVGADGGILASSS